MNTTKISPAKGSTAATVSLVAYFVLIIAFVAVIAMFVSAGLDALQQVVAVLPSGDTDTSTPVWQGSN